MNNLVALGANYKILMSALRGKADIRLRSAFGHERTLAINPHL